MAKQDQADIATLRIGEARSLSLRAAIASSATAQAQISRSRAATAADNTFYVWRNQHLLPAYNRSIDFTSDVCVPAGKRSVIEVATATISVPNGEKVRLRMYVSLGSAVCGSDLSLAPQGQLRGRQILVATDSSRVYSDYLIEFNISRDNAQQEGDAFIAVSGYFTDE
jgi:hypothetical protein